MAPSGQNSPPRPVDPCSEDADAYVPRSSGLQPYVGREQALSVAVAHRVRASSPQIKACYEVELESGRTSPGQLRVLFTVQLDGSVSEVSTQDNTLSEEMAVCVMAIVGAMHFTPGPVCGPTSYRFPFLFEPDPER